MRLRVELYDDCDPYFVVTPYSTWLPPRMSVCQLMVTDEEVMLFACTAKIVGGVEVVAATAPCAGHSRASWYGAVAYRATANPTNNRMRSWVIFPMIQYITGYEVTGTMLGLLTCTELLLSRDFVYLPHGPKK